MPVIPRNTMPDVAFCATCVGYNPPSALCYIPGRLRQSHCVDCCTCVICEPCGLRIFDAQPSEYCTDCERCSGCCGCSSRCPNCFCETIEMCERCGECEACCDCRDLVILPYQTLVTDYYGFLGKRRDRPYLGCEIEVEAHPSISCIGAAKVWNKSLEDWAITKHDSSLNNGFEIVSRPATLIVHQEKWPQIISSDLKKCVNADNEKTCGMHVHISRTFFSQLHVAKLARFINARQNRDYIVSLAGRVSHHYAKFEEKIKWSCMDDDVHGRYEALNITNRKTLEFRIFQSTLDIVKILGNLEFCHAVSMFTKNISCRHAGYWVEFCEFAKTNKKKYPNLVKLI